jgi:hypothetical protein
MGLESVAVLRPEERISLDAGPLLDLAHSMGPGRAEKMADNAIEEMVVRLASVEASWTAGEFQRLAKMARSLVGIADQLGMVTVAGVAREVCALADGHDDVALGAVVARLVRVGEASLASVWGMGHQRI